MIRGYFYVPIKWTIQKKCANSYKATTLQDLNRKKQNNMNRKFRSTKIEPVIKKLPTNRSPEPEDFTGEFY